MFRKPYLGHTRLHKGILKFSTLVLSFFILQSCKKLVEIGPPTDTITTQQVFENNDNANAAVVGIYSKILSKGATGMFGNGALTVYTGLSGDELISAFSDQELDQFYRNILLQNNTKIETYFWNQPYSYIYQANASIEQLQNSTNVSPQLKDRLLGEAKFLRAFCYFYVVNFFENIPYITSTSWAETARAMQIPKESVLNAIIDDLVSAKQLLPSDYNNYSGERVRATKWAASALLARVYLYVGNWAAAESEATNVITNAALFNLVPSPNQVFLKNSQEAILQWYIEPTVSPYNCTPEGKLIIPTTRTSPTSYFLSAKVLSEFESGDNRRKSWVDSTKYLGTVYYIPYKYKTGPGQMVVNGIPNEYYMVLRLAEQYLIRAEARIKQSKLSEALSDINVIRSRAGLSAIAGGSSTVLLDALMKERRIELFCEWGHRWLDLKRNGVIDQTMTLVALSKGTSWSSYSKLYPIPLIELITNPNLVQNSGY